jgi:hypothetical protein
MWDELRKEGQEVVILSRDHDMRSMLDQDTVLVWKKDVYTAKDFEHEFEFKPGVYEIYLAAAGDSSDDIPAAILASQRPKLKQILADSYMEDFDTVFDRTLHALDLEDNERFAKNYALVCKGGEVFDEVGEFNAVWLADWYDKMEMKSMLKTIDDLEGAKS